MTVISSINKTEYTFLCGMNITVYDSDGSPRTVEYPVVANHTGDIGMKWIADRIIEGVHY